MTENFENIATIPHQEVKKIKSEFKLHDNFYSHKSSEYDNALAAFETFEERYYWLNRAI